MRKEKLLGMLMRHKVTLAATVFSSLYMFMDSFINVDLFRLLVTTLAKIKESNAEEIFLGAIFILTGFLIDKIRFWKEKIRRRKIDEEKLSTLRSTMTTVHDVVNNFLNNLLFFRFEAEKSAALEEETLKAFDDLISDTANKLQEIDALEKILKRDFGSGIAGIVTPSKAGE